MRVRRAWLGAGVASCLLAPSAVEGQGGDRIWAEVRTRDGTVREGFVRWDRNETSWVDLLNGAKRMDVDLQDRMAEALGEDLDLRGRSVEFMGVRISWDDDGDGPEAAESGVRFGHVLWLVPDGDEAALGLTSGEEIRLGGGRTDLGTGMRELLLEVPGREPEELSWDDLERVDFGAAPAGARPREARLYGTVEDRWGDAWTGWLAWDLDEALEGDVLDGEEDGRDREVRFGTIASIEPVFEGGARVRTKDGRETVLRGTNDVDDGHRGVQVSDPGLGLVTVSWRDVRRVEFTPAPPGPGRTDFDGGHRLRGVVETAEGTALAGTIVWDADEAWSWEMLNGARRGLTFEVDFGNVSEIRRRSSRSAEVILRDGRTLVLEGSNDVDRTNKGIVVESDDGTLQIVDWGRFRSVVFEGE